MLEADRWLALAVVVLLLQVVGGGAGPGVRGCGQRWLYAHTHYSISHARKFKVGVEPFHEKWRALRLKSLLTSLDTFIARLLSLSTITITT